MTTPSKSRTALLSVVSSLIIALVTLAFLEIVLRVADFRELRASPSGQTLNYAYDSELGWLGEPHSSTTITTFRTTHARHNSLGLRDEEFRANGKPAIVFLGDSFVWGLDSEASERFSELLRPKFTDYNIVPAAIAGYGTDQEYLLLKRLWPTLKPAVVVLIFCSDNDRLDNTSNFRYDNYKPYFMTQPDGSLVLMGEPVPRSHLLYIRDYWLVRNLWLARLAMDAYVRVTHRELSGLPDPSEKLVGKIREFVESNGGKFLVGIQNRDERMETYLKANKIPFVSLKGAAFYTGGYGPHWTPEGQQDVANRIEGLLAANGVVAKK
jgi:hypothetical protein